MRKVILILAGLILFVLLGSYCADRLMVPQFKAMKYQRTDQTLDCLAIITDAGCSTNYIYTATGAEGEIVSRLVAELQKRGYALRSSPANYDVFCGSASYRDSDMYVFTELHSKRAHPAEMYFEFYLPGPGRQVDELKFKQFGCNNIPGVYTIELSIYGAQD
ncbi:hypothetical protein [Streptomyces sp. TLI_185]|uniref:hypothetical protein n=1 Tax=Streptomyces sp. TLI_185 TaxID=2485151 RepID=UPI000F4E1663|nr:hypothetical protein [Streptomyces sp. TLI_185]RPF39357.1 hypothetical protein EDD92_9607 [Streptomyces sp. TLI_185]